MDGNRILSLDPHLRRGQPMTKPGPEVFAEIDELAALHRRHGVSLILDWSDPQAALDLWVHVLEPPPNRDGRGGRAVTDALALADTHHLAVTLVASADSDGPLDNAALIAWYASFGFVQDPPGGTQMWRDAR